MKKIPQPTANAVCALLAPYLDLSPEGLCQALKNFEGTPDDPAANLPVFVDKHRAARLLGVSWFTIVRWVKDGTLQGVKIGSSWRIPASEIERLAGGES